MKKGRAQTMTHDYKRHGTTTLFAALNVLDGTVIGQCQQRHTHVEWLKFLRQIDRETPKGKTLHLIADNYATHKHPAVQEWLAKHPRFHMHFTPTSASWLNMVERFFRDITTERLRRGCVHQRARAGSGDQRLRRPSQHRPQAVHLDQERPRHPAEGHPGRTARLSSKQPPAPASSSATKNGSSAASTHPPMAAGCSPATASPNWSAARSALFLTELEDEIEVLDPAKTELVPTTARTFNALLYLEACAAAAWPMTPASTSATAG
jgi:transposase